MVFSYPLFLGEFPAELPGFLAPRPLTPYMVFSALPDPG